MTVKKERKMVMDEVSLASSKVNYSGTQVTLELRQYGWPDNADKVVELTICSDFIYELASIAEQVISRQAMRTGELREALREASS